ncbi:hypothetical protein QO010_001307 [Caulobacter ginsengisoli]|uniref:Aspartyl beta-hydroxylase n=1 Tax=Caulobacter ginsengisoli TaxID=400775 RepID=A0ABU0INF8_9CAUL|nr:hypothetical protein [Caulobacter ginsengisoli]MDQ0463536.1 hypothetical protein [Caulobacter ginsengisoli]
MPADAWEAVRQTVLADPARQNELWALDQDAFRRRLTELGAPAQGGWPWDPGPVGIGPGTPVLPQPPPGPGWTLSYLDSRRWPPLVHWVQTGGEPLAAPFHNHDAYSWSRRPLNRFLDVRTPFAALADASGADPAGIVFHMSRCGSTLTSRMLGALPGVLALSEPRAVADVLRFNRFDRAADDAERARRLRAVTAVLAGGARSFVIKTDALSILDLATFRLAFPRTPWVFLYRDPVEVLLSQQRDRAPEMTQGLVDAGAGGQGLSADAFCAQALGQICAAAADGLAQGGRAIAYDDLPDAVETVIAPLFGLEADPRAMRAVTGFNARRGDQAFVDDRAARRAAASDEIKALAARWVAPALARLRPPA